MTQAAPQLSNSTPVSSSLPSTDRQIAVREFVRYFVASAIALGADTMVLHTGLETGMPLALAAAAGFTVGLISIYILCTRLVFNQRRLSSRNSEFFIFASVGAAGLLLTEVILYWTIVHLHWPTIVAKFVSAGFVFIFNFVIRKMFLFTPARGRKNNQ